MVGYISDMLPGMTEVGQVVALRMEAVLVGRPGDGVGDAFPFIGEGAGHHVVARLRLEARVRDAVLGGLDAIGRLIPARAEMGGGGA